MMTEELKPCPFCGYRARVEATRDAVGDYQGYVECMDCGATAYGPGDMKDAESAMYEAGRAWNRRYAERERSANVRDVRRMFADGDVVREDVTGEDRERYNARHRAWCREHRHEIKVREVMRKLRGESEA